MDGAIQDRHCPECQEDLVKDYNTQDHNILLLHISICLLRRHTFWRGLFGKIIIIYLSIAINVHLLWVVVVVDISIYFCAVFFLQHNNY